MTGNSKEINAGVNNIIFTLLVANIHTAATHRLLLSANAQAGVKLFNEMHLTAGVLIKTLR